MKISTYKQPVLLTRNGGTTEAKVLTEKRELLSESPQGEDTKHIISLSKELSDHNNKQLTIAKMSLSAKETEKEVVLEFKYLE